MNFGDISTRPTPCCVHLRSKSMACRGDERPGLLHHEESATTWCARTDEALGPDRRSAVHPECQPGRTCFEPAPSI
jgi:hypothetical protein